MNENIGFKTVPFGGFDKVQVIDYIEKLRNDFHRERESMLAEQEELRKQIAALEERLEGKEPVKRVFDPEQAALLSGITSKENAVSEINAAAERLKNIGDEVCQSIKEILETSRKVREQETDENA